jgi:hypothetical protein
MKVFSKTALLIATAATLAAAVPAQARDHRYDGDGISAGDVIAGALIIGGIAALASAGSSRDRYYYDNRRSYRDDDYGYNRDGYGSRAAVDQCIRAAQREASRYGWARITDVTTVERVRGGYYVKGRLVVENRRYRNRWNGGYDRYGYNYDRYDDGYDKGKFKCTSRYGGIDDLRVSGLNGYY